MIRTFVVLSALVIGLVSTGFAQPVAATPENAAAFIGDWTISAEGQQGPVQIPLTVKVDGGKVVATVSMQGQGTQISEISVNGKNLVLKYYFDYQGNSIDAAVTLTPSGDKVGASIAFAGGAYTMTGTAEKKKT